MEQDNQIITLSAGGCRIEIWSIGARLNGVGWNGFDGLVDGARTPEEARGPKLNHGSVVGPVANRIGGASFELDGTHYSFPANEGASTLLHSGDTSLRDRLWDVTKLTDTEAVFETHVPAMSDGFPGNRVFRARYRVLPDGFDLHFSARSDAPTLVNMALHPYWTLNATGRSGQSLMVAAETYLPVDALKIPTGDIVPVGGTIFDLRRIAVPNYGIDHNFCLTPPGDGRVSARLKAERGLALDIVTDAPGLQVFTGKDIGIAIEPQHWPDAPHHHNFPSIRIDPGSEYTQSTSYRFREV
jgi:aldose 1-epimerase